MNWLEAFAFVLALFMVLGNIKQHAWAWFAAIGSSLLYSALFLQTKLYAQAGLQIFFIVSAAWGWWRWQAEGQTNAARALKKFRAFRLQPIQWAYAIGSSACIGLVFGYVLDHYSDSPAPYVDGFISAIACVAQALLALKFLENWLFWIAVNAMSVILYASLGLWLTAFLYLMFIPLAAWGYIHWIRRSEKATTT